MENAALYRASLLAGFDRAILSQGSDLRYLNMLPRWRDKPQSSLSYMMEVVTRERGDGRDGWYVDDQVPAVDAFIKDVRCAIGGSGRRLYHRHRIHAGDSSR